MQLGSNGTATAYAWRSCSTQARNFNSTCWADGNNTFLVPENVHVSVMCGSHHVSMSEWQHAYGRESGGRVVSPLPAVSELIAQARRTLDVHA